MERGSHFFGEDIITAFIESIRLTVQVRMGRFKNRAEVGMILTSHFARCIVSTRFSRQFYLLLRWEIGMFQFIISVDWFCKQTIHTLYKDCEAFALIWKWIRFKAPAIEVEQFKQKFHMSIEQCNAKNRKYLI